MTVELRRFVQDTSRRTGRPTLGRSGFTVYRDGKDIGQIDTDDEVIARKAADELVAAVDLQRRVNAHWSGIPHEYRRKLRQEYAEFHWDDHPSVAHFAYATR